ncbi:MAG: hypothetical protein AAGA10_02310 [Bacteroidota bacterium]
MIKYFLAYRWIILLGGAILLGSAHLHAQQNVRFGFTIDSVEVKGNARVSFTSGDQDFSLSKQGEKIIVNQKTKEGEVGLKMRLTLIPFSVEDNMKGTQALGKAKFFIQKKSSQHPISYTLGNEDLLGGDVILDMKMDWTEAQAVLNKENVVFEIKEKEIDKPSAKVSIPFEINLLDADADGVPDAMDDCPKDKGALKDKGCPPKAPKAQNTSQQQANTSQNDSKVAKEEQELGEDKEEESSPVIEADTSNNTSDSFQQAESEDETLTNGGEASSENAQEPDPNEVNPNSGPGALRLAELPDILLSVALVLVLLLLGILIWKSRREKKNSYAKRMVDVSGNTASKGDSAYKKDAHSAPTSTLDDEPSGVMESEPEEVSQEEAATPLSEDEISLLGEIDFTEKEKEAAPFPYDDPTLRTHYLPISLWECWEDTTVRQIYLHKRSIRQIDQHIRGENLYKIDPETGDEIPEIGGFLMGFLKEEEGQFELCIERFIPITPESNNRFTVKFGDRAWIEWSDAQSKFPDELLLGWFHTHPGHGLFLSEADIKVQKDQFTLEYLVAMEIDTLTPDFDAAFFTWKQGGKHLNNAEDRKLNSWYSFMDMDRATRLNS